jgi:hypothetical protein
VALCRMSVGGAVASIFRLVALRSILLRVSLNVVSMVGLSSRPRCRIVEEC